MANNFRRRLYLPALLSVWFSILQDPHPAHGFTTLGLKNVDLLVGLDSSINLDTRGFAGIQHAGMDTPNEDLQKKSIRNILGTGDALLTLVLEGNETFLNEGHTMEIEDMISIHFMEGSYGGKSIERVLELLEEDRPEVASGGTTRLNGAFGFALTDDSPKLATLVPSNELLKACPENPPLPTLQIAMPASCVIRRDIVQRAPKKGSLEDSNFLYTHEITAYTDEPGGQVLEQDSQEREADTAFIRKLVGDDKDAAKTSFEIAKRYNLDRKNRRAFWINPAYYWYPQQSGGTFPFIVSQRILLFVLINYYTEGGGSRRRLLSKSESGTVAAADISFSGIDAHALVASIFDVKPEKVASFSADVQLTEAQACMPDTELRAELLTMFTDIVTEASSLLGAGVVQLTSMDVNRALSCGTLRRSGQLRLQGRGLLQFSPANAELVVMVVFTSVAGLLDTIDVDQIEAQPWVNSFTPLRVSKNDIDMSPLTLEPPEEKGTGSSLLVVLASVGAGVGLVLSGILAYWWHKKSSDKPRIESGAADLVNTYPPNNNNNQAPMAETRGIPSAPGYPIPEASPVPAPTAPVGEGVKSDLVMQLESQLNEDRPQVVADFAPERAAEEAAEAAASASEGGSNRRSSQTLARVQSKRSSGAGAHNEIVPKQVARVDSKMTRTSGVSRVDSKNRKDKEDTPVRVNSRLSRRSSDRSSDRDRDRDRPIARQESRRSERPMARVDSRNTRRSGDREDRRPRDYDRDDHGIHEEEETESDRSGDEGGSDIVMELEQKPVRDPRRRPSHSSSIAPSVYSTSSQQASANKVHKWLKKSKEFVDDDGFVEM